MNFHHQHQTNALFEWKGLIIPGGSTNVINEQWTGWKKVVETSQKVDDTNKPRDYMRGITKQKDFEIQSPFTLHLYLHPF